MSNSHQAFVEHPVFEETHQVWKARFLTCLCAPCPYPSRGHFTLSSSENKWHLHYRQCYVPDIHGLKGGKCITKWNQMSLQLCTGQLFCKWCPPVRQGGYTDVEKDHTLAKMDLAGQCWTVFTQWLNSIAVVAAVIVSLQQSLASSAETSSPPTPPSRLSRQQTIKSFRSHMQIQGPALEGLL